MFLAWASQQFQWKQPSVQAIIEWYFHKVVRITSQTVWANTQPICVPSQNIYIFILKIMLRKLLLESGNVPCACILAKKNTHRMKMFTVVFSYPVRIGTNLDIVCHMSHEITVISGVRPHT